MINYTTKLGKDHTLVLPMHYFIGQTKSIWHMYSILREKREKIEINKNWERKIGKIKT